MKNIIKTTDLPDGEKVFLKKNMFGYSVVHPVKNQDGSINWINMLIGGWGNLFKLLFVLLVILLFIYGVKEMMESCKDFTANPCKYIDLDCSNRYTLNYLTPQIDIPKLNFSSAG